MRVKRGLAGDEVCHGGGFVWKFGTPGGEGVELSAGAADWIEWENDPPRQERRTGRWSVCLPDESSGADPSLSQHYANKSGGAS
jgi:hypothetical protein